MICKFRDKSHSIIYDIAIRYDPCNFLHNLNIICFFLFQPTQNLSRLTKFITNPVRQTAQCIVVELQMA